MTKLILPLFLILLFTGPCLSQKSAQSVAIEAFAAKTGATHSMDKATGSLSFLTFPAAKPYQVAGDNVQQKSMQFLKENAGLFAFRQGQDDHRFKDQQTDIYGLENVTLQQTYQGVPIYDGLMRFHYNRNRDLNAMNGNFIAGIKVSPVPTLSQHEAESLAMKSQLNTQRPEKPKHPLRVNKSTLYIFQKGLAQGYKGSTHLAYEVEVRNDVDIRQFVFIDAHTGEVLESFSGIHQIDRRLYEESISPSTLVWKEGDALPGKLNVWQESEVKSAGFIYNLMKNTFGRTSYNGADATMVTVNNNPDINCPNANWNGISANYCDGMATDDVVAHEWAHAYTEYTSNLIYKWQPGALNEALSDIWGETVDQLNGYFDQNESNARRTGCGSSARWQIGEQTTAFDGAIRDMWNPNCFNNPGRVNDPMYWCAPSDDGGVHINSGVVNHAYALLVDGGTYNGQTIAGIGLTKAAHIFWLAQSQYMTATTDFAACADMLVAAAGSLVGVNLPSLTTGTAAATKSGSAITQTDLTQLNKVILATEMRSEVGCGFTTLLKPVPSLCEGAKKSTAIFYEDFENGLGSFKATYTSTSGSWTPRTWVVTDAPAGRGGKVVFADDFTGGDCNGSVQNGLLRLESPTITIPAGTSGNINMAFDHYVATESYWDGGNIKYSINGATWRLLPRNAFTANGYNNVINTVAMRNDNPLAGQAAFSGTDEGKVTGSWGQSQLNLSALALNPGDQIRFRFEFGTDGCNGLDGWYIDDIRIYSCAVTPAVHFATTRMFINEGEGTPASGSCLGYVDRQLSVQIDKAPTQPVTVTFNTPTGTAKRGPNADYTISPASVTLAAGALSKAVTIRVFNDAYIEGPETINLSYSINANGGNGFKADSMQTCQITIVDDDLEPGNYTEQLLFSDFNNGQNGWSVTNGGNSEFTWTVVNYTDAGLDPQGTPFFFVNSNTDIQASITMDEMITSPVINTAGKKNLVLTFDQAWLPYDGGFEEKGTVEIWDGSAWRNIMTQTGSTPQRGDILEFNADKVTLNVPDAYANTEMRIRFRFVSGWDFWWGIDNVRLTSSNSNKIHSAVNTSSPDRQYLGPNETAVFYDPKTGDLLAKIRNLSAHDYGCTAVEVDRAGLDATSWINGYRVSKKTFKVTPTNNNRFGRYEITLYYKASELPTFNGATIRAMGKSEGGIGGNNSVQTSFAQVQLRAAFGSDFAYTATFDTGFSGFGLTDAPPSGPLPVTLIRFAGTHTAEGNALSWSTTSESNNDHFVVERTVNGIDFQEVGRVKGMGNSAATTRYHFTDATFEADKNYYRLKQVDFDGSFAYSQLITIDSDMAGELKFFPNPVQSTLLMELPEKLTGTADIDVLNASGQVLVSRKKVKPVNGKLSIDLGKLPSGNYQIKVTGEQRTYSRTVFKY